MGTTRPAVLERDLVMLPPYTVRRSTRARAARLVYSPDEGLVVVLPTRFPASRVPELVAAKLDWYRRAEERLGAVEATHRRLDRPGAIDLPALGERWELSYDTSGTRATLRATGPGHLVIAGEHLEDEELKALLCRWLTRRARSTLPPWLRALAGAGSVSVHQVSIRAQRTRWASCSASGNISLNRSLLFLEPHLVRQVLHHELCHRFELNHGPAFRSRLVALEPDSARNEAHLRSAWRTIPRWAR